MKDLAEPKTFQLEGPQIEDQDRLAQQLDEAIAAELVSGPGAMEALGAEEDEANQEFGRTKSKESKARADELHDARNRIRANLATYNDATFIGAVILTDTLGKTKDLVAKSELVNLPGLNDRQAKVKHSLIGGAYHIVQQRGLAPLVISNTFVAMKKARQLEYLRAAGLPNEKYIILVEVHYYRNRPTSSTKLHKDTRGETLFVNLSFTNKRRILGPEYIVNPASSAIYKQFVKQKLPEVFVKDLKALRRDFKGKKFIEATVLEANGVVAFVDEAIHHKTPTPGPRTASADGLKIALANVYGDEYEDAAKAYRGYKGASRFSPFTFGSYFKNPTAKAQSNDWWELLEKLPTLDRTLPRDQLRAWLPDYFKTRAEELHEQAATDFTDVSLAVDGGQKITVPVRGMEEEPLKRRMSVTDLSEFMAQEGGKRSFFRTWVRAVERDKFG